MNDRTIIYDLNARNRGDKIFCTLDTSSFNQEVSFVLLFKKRLFSKYLMYIYSNCIFFYMEITPV